MRQLPKSVFLKSGSYYYVEASGRKRIWHKLCRAKEGLPAMYAALSRLLEEDSLNDMMPAVIAQWQAEEMPRHSERTQKDDRARCKVLADALREFHADQVTAKDCAEVLKPFKGMPRTFNAYRALLRELMRFSVESGYRKDNPLEHIKIAKTKPRERYITDSELRRIKVAAMRGKDGKDTRSGPMLCALVDVALLTAQRIGDLLAMEWSQIERDGIVFRQGKTGAKVTVEWTPQLRDAIERLRRMRKDRRAFTPRVFTTQDGQPYQYDGAHTAWVRAVERAGVPKANFHDLRRKAGSEVARRDGIERARVLLGHTTQDQTADYVSPILGLRTAASR